MSAEITDPAILAQVQTTLAQPTPEALRGYAFLVAKQLGVPEDLVDEVGFKENRWKAEGTSSAGATGPMQLMPGTAKDLGVDPTNPWDNVRGGVTYLKQQLDAFGGDRKLAMAAYNAGPGAVRKAGGVPNFPETQAYVGNAPSTPASQASAPASTPAPEPSPPEGKEITDPNILAQVRDALAPPIQKIANAAAEYIPEAVGSMGTGILRGGAALAGMPGDLRELGNMAVAKLTGADPKKIEEFSKMAYPPLLAAAPTTQEVKDTTQSVAQQINQALDKGDIPFRVPDKIYQPQTPWGKYVEAGATGVTSLAGGGNPQTILMLGLLSGLGGEAGANFFKDQWWGRPVGSLAGLLPGLAGLRMPQVPKVLSPVLKEEGRAELEALSKAKAVRDSLLSKAAGEPVSTLLTAGISQPKLSPLYSVASDTMASPGGTVMRQALKAEAKGAEAAQGAVLNALPETAVSKAKTIAGALESSPGTRVVQKMAGDVRVPASAEIPIRLPPKPVELSAAIKGTVEGVDPVVAADKLIGKLGAIGTKSEDMFKAAYSQALGGDTQAAEGAVKVLRAVQEVQRGQGIIQPLKLNTVREAGETIAGDIGKVVEPSGFLRTWAMINAVERHVAEETFKRIANALTDPNGAAILREIGGYSRGVNASKVLGRLMRSAEVQQQAQ